MTHPAMRSATRRALDELRAHEETVLGGQGRRGVSADTLTKIAGELYAVADLLVAQPRLRRTLGDPATAPDSRAELAKTLFGGKVDRHTLDLVQHAVSRRWSTPWDLTDALEGTGDDALFATAEKSDTLDQVEDELFRFERILLAEGELSALLDEPSADVGRRIALLDGLLKNKVSPVTATLLQHAVGSQRKRSVVLAIDDLLETAAARRERSVARVISAVPLTDAQQHRLAEALSQMYGRAISVRTALDPDVRGGLVVRVGDEVIDGSIATQFAAARAALAG
jgi:F-type H+-transporting ATPase subunit delta